MTNDTAIDTARRRLFAVLTDVLEHIGAQQFKQRSLARRLRDRLIHRFTQPFQPVVTDKLTFNYNPYCEDIREVHFEETTFDLDSPDDRPGPLLTDYPTAIDGITTAIAEIWEETFDESFPHRARLKLAIEDLSDAITETQATATLDDLVDVIRSDRTEVVELFFDVDRPIADQEGTELAAMFGQPVETILYQDDELALILPERDSELMRQRLFAPSEPRPREAYVVGRDDTTVGFFVHAIDGTNLTPTSEVTDDMIRDAMGFDRELAPDTDVLAFDENERIRLQGDLSIEQRRPEDELRDWFRNRTRRDVEQSVTEEFIDQYLRKCGLDEYRDQLRITGRGTDLRITLSRTSQASEAIEAIEETFIYSSGSRGPSQSMSHGHPQRRRATQRLERRLTNYLTGCQDEYRETVERRLTRRVEESRKCDQLNLPIDNHLVILGSARLHPREIGREEPVRIVVPEQTSLHVIHDEHPQVDVQLHPGAYNLQLLARGIQPVAERPEW